MKQYKFTFYFKRGPITVWAFTENNAKILAQAEAIKRCWDPTLVSQPKLEKLDMVINWKQLTEDEQGQLYTLLCKAKYNGQMEDE
jgi:hypothetical protein